MVKPTAAGTCWNWSCFCCIFFGCAQPVKFDEGELTVQREFRETGWVHTEYEEPREDKELQPEKDGRD